MNQIKISAEIADELIQILQDAVAGEFEEAQLTLEDANGDPVEIVIEGKRYE